MAVEEIQDVDVLDVSCTNSIIFLDSRYNDPEACASQVLSKQLSPGECSTTFFYDRQRGICKCVKKGKHCELDKTDYYFSRYRLFKSML